MPSVDVTVIGGGVVGCAVAAEAAGRGLNTVLLEKETGLARGTTSRNSEVSHGGMYYPTGSNKARFCVEGRRFLKDFCAAAGVGYLECGKLIVAVTEEETAELFRLLELGRSNGVEDLRLVEADQLGIMEPEVRAVAALHSPRTGVLDAEGVARAFARQAEDHGARLLTSARVVGLERDSGGWQVRVEPEGPGRQEGWNHSSRWVVNAAGLRADQVAALAGIDTAERNWDLVLVKGNYFRIAPVHAGRLKRLIYPVPPADGSSLGVHVCLDLDGQMKLGPDTEVLDPAAVPGPGPGDGLDYAVDPDRQTSFFCGAVRFLPWLKEEDLTPDMAGYRPKLTVKGFRDFEVVRETGACEGLINLVGIDSPGLTSAPALARAVGRMLDGEE
jgi:L-2-hydroxyglutarate oxidase LhgO